jgi:hypothetical protein
VRRRRRSKDKGFKWALRGNGTTAYATFAEINLGKVHSIAFYMRFNTIDTNRCVISKSTIDRLTVNTSSRFVYRAGNGTVRILNVTENLVNEWNCFIFTRTNRSLAMYKNNEVAGTGTLIDGQDYDFLCEDIFRGVGYLNADIACISLATKLLDATERATFRGGGTPQTAGRLNPSILAAEWLFEEGSGNPQDTSGNGNHLTLVGASGGALPQWVKL